MFFLLKCGFWLALVYAAILYGIGPLGSFADGRFAAEKPPQVGAERAKRVDTNAVHTVVEAAAASVADLCTRRPAECFTEAKRLTALFEATAAEETAGGADKTPRVRQSASGRAVESVSDDLTPMPVPDPRRHARAFRLTPKP